MVVNLAYENYNERVHSLNMDHDMLNWLRFFSYEMVLSIVDRILYLFSGLGMKRLWKIGGVNFSVHLNIK